MKNKIKNIFILLMLIITTSIFGAIPHSYVTENPSKEVTQTETLKRKDKAELNLSVTKLKSTEIKVLYDPEQKKIFSTLDNIKHGIKPEDNIYISEKIQEIPSIITTNGRKKINGILNKKILEEGHLEYRITKEKNKSEIEIDYDKIPKEIYIGILDEQYQVKKILNAKSNDYILYAIPSDPVRILGHKDLGTAYLDIEITDEYDGDSIYRKGGNWKDNPVYGTNTGKGIKILGYTKFNNGQGPLPYRGGLHQTSPGVMCAAIGRLEINDKIFAEANKVSDNPKKYYIYTIKNRNNYYYGTFDLNDELNITLTRYNHGDEYGVKLNKFPKRDFEIKIYMYGVNYFGTENNRKDYSVDFTTILRFKYKSAKLEGISNLTIDKNYKKEYIPFNSCTLESQQNIALERAVNGVSLQQTTGKGLVTLESGDIFTVNGQQHNLTSNSLTEQNLTLNGINLSYKVESGKLQLKVNNYDTGITQAQPLTLKVTRAGKEIMNHTMNITVPNIQTLSGNSTLTFGENYPVNTYVNFNANSSLTDTNSLQLENSIQGVTFNTTGNGILQVKSGDRLSVNGNEMAVGYNNNIDPQRLRVGNLNYTYKVENGKFRLSLNDWGVLEPDRNIEVKVLRDNKVVSTHNFTVKAPRKITGNSNLNIDKQYTPGTTIRFQGISLTAPTDGSLENPTPPGVAYKTVDGYGIPFMQDGDILEINDGVTRVARSFNISSNGTLGLQTIKMTTSELGLSVQSGKLRLALNKWFSDSPINLHLTLKRGTNKIMEHTLVINVPSVPKVEGVSNLAIDNSYKNEYIKFNSCTLDNLQPISLMGYFQGVTLNSLSGNGLLTLEQGDTLSVNGQQNTINHGTLADQNLVLNGINLSYKVENGKVQLRINSYDMGITSAQPLTIKITRNSNEIMSHTMNITVPNVQKLIGQSSLTIAKEYSNEYIPFTSCTLENQQNIALERVVNGVTLQQTTGKGLLTLENGDTLTVNGRQHMLNSNSLVEQNTTVNGIYLSYKVENGKVQLRVNNYDMGITQAQPLTLIVNRSGKEVMNHTMNITVPNIQKIVGESQLNIGTDYKNEDIKFDSCTVDNLKPISLISPTIGVTLNSLSGNGLLELKANDTLSINGQQHILNSNSLSEQKLNIGSIKLSYKVVSGKVQLKINGYGLGITQAHPLTIKLTRDNKEIMQHIINVKVPNIQKLVGESELSIIDGYNNDYMTIKGCTLENPEIISFVTPVTGTIITQVTGKGILKFEAGDILEINGVQSTVNSTGGVSERSENIGGISTSYKAQNGNLQIRIIDYPLNQQSPQMYNIKLYRKGIQVLEHTMKIFVPEIIVDNSKTNLKIRDEYKEEAFNIENLPYNVKGIEYMSGSDRIKVYTPNNYRSIKSKSFRKIDSINTYFGYLKINGKTIAKKKAKIIEAQTLNLNGVTVDIQKNGDLIISLKNYAKKISKPFELNIESSSITAVEHSYGGSNSNHNGSSDRTVETYHRSNQNIVFYYVPSKVVGNSTLEVKEYYPTPEYIEFNSCTTPDPKPIALENSLRDVKVIQNSGNGLVNLENGDILELNGKEYHIGAGGNLPEQKDVLGEINFKFKVENGKLRLALTSWGILEPDRILTINAKRETYPIMEHKMTIQSPRRVEGKASLIFNEKYPIRETIRFQGISLTAPTDGSLENPTPPGVTYKTVDGYGITFMKEGDILEIITPNQRAVQKYTIDKNNGLNNFILDLPGTTLSLGVNSGKLRLGLNNWLVNKDSALNLRIVRGVNEICKMNLTLEVPKAPFDIIKNGILDFGKVIQGSKNKKAETSILLDMHRDVSDVKFNLSTENPELINSTGKSLNARNLQAGVHKQGKNRYLVRVIGALDVPSDQELGVYRGSVLLNVTIK